MENVFLNSGGIRNIEAPVLSLILGFGGVAVIIAASQAADLGSNPGQCIGGLYLGEVRCPYAKH